MEQTLKALSITSIILIILGYLNLHSYYTKFDIEIYNYVSSTELLLSFSPILITIAISLIAFAIGYIKGFHRNSKESDYDISKDQTTSFTILRGLLQKRVRAQLTSQVKIRLIRNLLWSPFVIVSITITFMVVIIIYGYFLNSFYLEPINEGFLFMIFSWGYFSFSSYLIDKLSPVLKVFTEKNLLLSVAIVTLVYLIIYLISCNSIKYKKIISGKPLYSVTLETDNRIIETNDSLVFIGSTKEFYFFRSKITNENLIIKDSEVKYVKSKKLRYGRL